MPEVDGEIAAGAIRPAAAVKTLAGELRQRLRRALTQGMVLAMVGVLLGAGINLLRSEPLPWVAQKPYTILVPCTEKIGEAEPLEPADGRVRDAKSLVIDARARRDYEAWHLPGALFVEFDWLGPPVDEEVERIALRVAQSGARRVVVYGDGDDPDTGKQWARLMSGAKLKHVFFVEGGAPALRKVAKERQP